MSCCNTHWCCKTHPRIQKNVSPFRGVYVFNLPPPTDPPLIRTTPVATAIAILSRKLVLNCSVVVDADLGPVNVRWTKIDTVCSMGTPLALRPTSPPTAVPQSRGEVIVCPCLAPQCGCHHWNDTLMPRELYGIWTGEVSLVISVIWSKAKSISHQDRCDVWIATGLWR